ncbi:MAG: glycosyltransferase family 39 protein [Flavobacteriales bacterium]
MKKGVHFSFIHRHIGPILFFIAFLIALLSFDEYGLGWDEPQQRGTGKVCYDYVFSEDSNLLRWSDRDYGVAFELPLIILEKTFNLTDSRTIYLMRHLVTHLFFLLGCYFLFRLIDYLYNNKLLSTVGFLLLVLHPRLYSHSFFNTKDIPFMTMFIISIYYSVKALDKKNVLSFIKSGICIGLLINLRIMGIILPVFLILLLLVEVLKKQNKRLQLKLALTLLVSSCLVLYISWPYLWADPINRFIISFENMSKFRWKDTLLFNGEMIKATEIDWTYIPTWFSITTPIIFLLLGVFGSLILIFQFFKSPLTIFNNSIKSHNLLFLALCISPLIAVSVLHSVLYDGWRQLYFIYPFFVLLIIYGLSFLAKRNKKSHLVVLCFLCFSFVSTSTFMVRNFPLQNVYFNNFFSFVPPEYIRKNFELDYWGVSYKQSLEYILKVDTNASVNINVANSAGFLNISILKPADRNRINIVPIEEATYFITNYRWHPQDYIEYETFKFHSFVVKNNTISQIFKLK